jgi:hypothetical protein
MDIGNRSIKSRNLFQIMVERRLGVDVTRGCGIIDIEEAFHDSWEREMLQPKIRQSLGTKSWSVGWGSALQFGHIYRTEGLPKATFKRKARLKGLLQATLAEMVGGIASEVVLEGK